MLKLYCSQVMNMIQTENKKAPDLPELYVCGEAVYNYLTTILRVSLWLPS